MKHIIKNNISNYLCVDQRMWVIFATVFILSMSFGCGPRAKTVMDLSVPQTPDPNGTKIVKIAKISDLRKFVSAPSDWSTPTVARSNEITDRAITVRTIGQAHGKSDIILPEGKTVEMLVGDAVQKALREKGYSVVLDITPSVAEIIPIEVDINKFWLWFVPGMWVVTVYYEAEIDLKGPIVLNGSKETVTGRYEISSPMAVPGMYSGTAESGLANLITNAKARFKEK